MKEEIGEEFLINSISNDVFNRNRVIKKMINDISNFDEQKWFAINGHWGSGKTIFVRQLEYILNNYEKCKKFFPNLHLNEENCKCKVFYYNGWENDSCDNPIYSIMYQLLMKNDKSYEIQSIPDKYKKLFSMLIKIGLSVATKGMIDIDAENLKTNDVFEEIKTADEIRKLFNNVIEDIFAEEHEKMIIIIDELDRCKPTFSVTLLEYLKHYFVNDNVFFVFSVNMEQLACTIKKIYGSEYDGLLYLYRFFDKIYDFNKYDLYKYITTYLDYNIRESHMITDACNVIIKYYNMSIRETSRFINEVKYYRDSKFYESEYYKCNDCSFAYIRFFLFTIAVGMKCNNYNDYLNFINGDFVDLDKIVICDNKIHQYLENDYKDYIKSNKTYEFINDEIEYIVYLYKSVFKEQSNTFINQDEYEYLIENLTV